MRRFLVHDGMAEGGLINLTPEESRHAVKSLRLGEGSRVLLTDGKGREAEGVIRAADPNGVTVEIKVVRDAEARVSIEVLQAVLKGPKMDWLMEKLTEIGVAAVHLAVTRHTVVAGEKIERWQRIAQSAVKQSGNLLVPSLFPARPLADILPELGDGLKILLQPGAAQGLAQVVKERSPNRVILAIGPEGGFSAEEEKHLRGAGFIPAALSRQILRGETAALVAAALAAHSIDF